MNRNKLTFQRRFKCFSAIYILFIFIVIALAFNVWAQGSFKEGASDNKSKPAFSDKDIQPGEHEYKVDGNRKYLLYIPATYNTKKPTPLVLFFHGGAGEDAFRDESKVTDFTSVKETINRWVIRNNADKVPERILTVPGAYAELYKSKHNNTQIELVVTETGGHSWPGGKPVRGKIPSRAIIANDLIWEFFMRQAP